MDIAEVAERSGIPPSTLRASAEETEPQSA